MTFYNKNLSTQLFGLLQIDDWDGMTFFSSPQKAKLVVNGDATVQNLTVSGTLTAPNIPSASLEGLNINSGTINNLISTDISTNQINVANVTTTHGLACIGNCGISGTLTCQSLSLFNNLSVDGDMSVTGSFHCGSFAQDSVNCTNITATNANINSLTCTTLNQNTVNSTLLNSTTVETSVITEGTSNNIQLYSENTSKSIYLGSSGTTLYNQCGITSQLDTNIAGSIAISDNMQSSTATVSGNMVCGGCLTYGGGIGCFMVDVANGSYPIFCSIANYNLFLKNDSDDYYLLMPGYSITVYNSFSYVGTPLLTKDNSSGTSVMYCPCAYPNAGSSIQLYYRGNLISVSGIS